MPILHAPILEQAGFVKGALEPVINHVARSDGFSQYWQLSGPIELSSGHRIEFDLFGVTEINTRMGLLSDPIFQDYLRLHDSGEIRFREGSAYIADTSINDGVYIQQPQYPYGAGSNNIKSILRDGRSASFNVVGAAHNGDFFRFYLSGAIYNIKHYDENDILLHEIPLTNKSQGATQLATVGSVNATMVNYTPDVWEEVEPVINYVYALRSSAYDYAELTSEVVVPHKGVISFTFATVEGDTSTAYIMEGSTGSYIYYRGSDGRFRLYSDQGEFYTITVPDLNDGLPHDILLTIDDDGMHLYLDGSFFGEVLKSGNTDTFSVSKIGEGVTAFNVTLANLASYPMLTDDASGVNVADEIGSNNLTYVNLKDPLNAEDYLKVVNND